MKKSIVSIMMSELGKKGAEARTKALSVTRRKEIAKYASDVRWKKHATQ